MLDEIKYPYIYFFVGRQGLTFGALLNEEKPVFSDREENIKVTLKNPFAPPWALKNKLHYVPTIDLSKVFDLPVLINGQRQQYRAKVFLHDYYGNELSGVIPTKTSWEITQLKDALKIANSRVSDLTQENYKMRTDYERKLDELTEQVKKLKNATWQPIGGEY